MRPTTLTIFMVGQECLNMRLIIHRKYSNPTHKQLLGPSATKHHPKRIAGKLIETFKSQQQRIRGRFKLETLSAPCVLCWKHIESLAPSRANTLLRLNLYSAFWREWHSQRECARRTRPISFPQTYSSRRRKIWTKKEGACTCVLQEKMRLC